MANAAQKLGTKRAETMGLPAEQGTGDQPQQNSLTDTVQEPSSASLHVTQSAARSDAGMDAAPAAHPDPTDRSQPEERDGQEGDSQLPTNNGKAKGEVPAPKRRRGRPPKSPSAAPASSPTANHDIPKTPEVTPGGRPKRRAATAALRYLHELAKDMVKPSADPTNEDDDDDDEEERPDAVLSPRASRTRPRGKGKGKGQKRKTRARDSDGEDEDFVPDRTDEARESDEEDSVNEGDESEPDSLRVGRPKASRPSKHGMSPNQPSRPSRHSSATSSTSGANGLAGNVMQVIWSCFRGTKDFRGEHHSPWVFPEWIPSASEWHFLSASQAERYLPRELESAAFTFSRDGHKKDTLHRLNRFEALPYHKERWDSLFFVGGPVWSAEWCPCPDGAGGSQYVALYCHRGMEDRHKANRGQAEPALLQLWDLGLLQHNSRPSSVPRLAYALALDDGCVWNMKWCPAGAWEIPTTSRKLPQMARLGLLAAAFSNGNIGVFSLPHPDSLQEARASQPGGEADAQPLICQVRSLLHVRLGSSQAERCEQTGPCVALDWLPVKPHTILAAGFYDGLVALWDLASRSPLQRVKAPDSSIILYPYHCFIAHDDAVRTVGWCRGAGDLMVTAGDDRMVKMWDVRKSHTPLVSIRRYLTTEAEWPLSWSGVLLTQECCYASYGHQGIHYIDSGYCGLKPHFLVPRKATVWSCSSSDWLNCCVIGDNMGDVVMSLLHDLEANPYNVRRRRFPVYWTEMVAFKGSEGVAEGGGASKPSGATPKPSGATPKPSGATPKPSGATPKPSGATPKPSGATPKPSGATPKPSGATPEQEPQSYSGAVQKYYLNFHDMDVRNFRLYHERPIVKHLFATEAKGVLKVDQMPLGAIYKVRMSPNMCSHSWVVSAGQAGLVRLHCVQGLSSAVTHKLLHDAHAHFNSMFPAQEQPANQNAASTVHHSTAQTMQVL